ncbi:MAG TPA: hypothetical protein VE870_17445, partial [Bacteroidales bacterium]|nr:hypothetical protein [Bacteroidales bacterium]
FSIQIGAFRRPVRSSYIHEMQSTAGRYKLNTDKWNGLTIYSIGKFTTYQEAFDIKKRLDGAPFIDGAFIVAWVNDRKISVSEANAILTGNRNEALNTSER